MKVLLLASLVLLASCGQRTKTKYVENPYDNSGNEARFGNLETRVGALESVVALNVSQIGLNSATIANLRSGFDSQIIAYEQKLEELKLEISMLKVADQNATHRMEQLQSEIDTTNSDIRAYVGQGYAAYSDIMDKISTLQATNGTLNSSVLTLQTQMAQLQSGVRVVDVVDPCPSVASTGFKEYFFKLSNGKFVAFFEQGGNRFNTELLPGYNYQTTDSRACRFNLNSAGNIVN